MTPLLFPRRPSPRIPARRGTVVGLGGAGRNTLMFTGRLIPVRTVAAVRISVGLRLRGLGGLTGLCDSRLEGRLGNRQRPRLAALYGQLARRLDRRFVRRDAAAEIVEHGEPRPLFDVGEDSL